MSLMIFGLVEFHDVYMIYRILSLIIDSLLVLIVCFRL